MNGVSLLGYMLMVFVTVLFLAWMQRGGVDR